MKNMKQNCVLIFSKKLWVSLYQNSETNSPTKAGINLITIFNFCNKTIDWTEYHGLFNHAPMLQAQILTFLYSFTGKQTGFCSLNNSNNAYPPSIWLAMWTQKWQIQGKMSMSCPCDRCSIPPLACKPSTLVIYLLPHHSSLQTVRQTGVMPAKLLIDISI